MGKILLRGISLGGVIFLLSKFNPLSLWGAESPKSWEEITLEEIKITSQAETISWERLPQEVFLVEGDLLKKGVEVYSPVDLRKRGSFGVQEDLSIRGTNFEQNLILVEGLRLSDIQTGHHLLNLPLVEGNLEAMEILPGGASPTYGPSGFGGAINSILRKPKDKASRVLVNFGSYDYQQYQLSLDYKLSQVPLSLNLENKKANGFIWNRDFEIKTVNLYTKDERQIFFYGFTEKDFGARYFYTPRYPTEWEETRTQLLFGKRLFNWGNLSFEPGLLVRINYDHYLLDRDRPSFYQNKHQSEVFRLNLPWKLNFSKSILTFGLEGSYETLDSTRLGSLLRRSLGLYGGLNHELTKKLFLDLKARYDLFLHEKDFLSTQIGVSYFLREGLKLRAQANLSYRLPSATELKYDSIGIKGNPDLSPEKALNLETGFEALFKGFYLSFTLFHRRGTKLIDWISNQTGTFAENIDVGTTGGTFSLSRTLPVGTLFLSYTYLNQKGKNLLLSRYHGNYLRHNLKLFAKFNLPYESYLTIYFNPQKRINQKEVYLLGLELEKRIKNWQIILWGENLFDEKYYDIYYPLSKKGVLATPRWLGVKIAGGF